MLIVVFIVQFIYFYFMAFLTHALVSLILLLADFATANRTVKPSLLTFTLFLFSFLQPIRRNINSAVNTKKL